MAAYPALLADMGGTFVRVAIVARPDEPYRLLVKDRTASYATAIDMLKSALGQHRGAKPLSVWLSVAGRVIGRTARLTNAALDVDADAIARATGIEEVHLINDFAATAAALIKPEAIETRVIGPDLPERPGNCVVIGPGTGLGCAALLRSDRWRRLHPTEAGHIECGASTPEEMELWRWIERPHGRLTTENLLSGAGLIRLHQALAKARGSSTKPLEPAEISARGLLGEGLEREALRWFCRILGRFAGDLALVFGAEGGIFIAGGIASYIRPILEEGEFRLQFERKWPFEGVVASIPTRLMTGAEPTLDGLSVLCVAGDDLLR